MANTVTPKLGKLNHLPLEILQHALAFLSLTDLRVFSTVNIRAKEVVETIYAWREILRHAPDAETRIFRGRVAETVITPNRIYQELRHECCNSRWRCILEAEGTDLKRTPLNPTAVAHGVDPKYRCWNGPDLIRSIWGTLRRDCQKEIEEAEEMYLEDGLQAMSLVM